METSQYSFRLVSTSQELEKVLAVRYQVYTEERRWTPQHPSGLEFDEWDLFSTHLLASHYSRNTIVGTDNQDAIVGTVRIVFDSRLGFPFEKAHTLPAEYGREKMYEVSRLAVLPEHRESNNSLILVGLCRAVWHHTNALGKRTWCAVVDEPVARLLKLLRFRFIYEGTPVFHLGSWSIPLVCDMEVSRKVLFAPRVNEMLARHIETVYGEN